ncbi:MAG: hypothetical protein K2G21_02940 [Muribaculaceae bacterium]|nr:hypothetical protein [Muribaculaceae bacterium]
MNTTMKLLSCLLALGVSLSLSAASVNEKSIYIPHDLQDMDLSDPSSKWSTARMASTENVVLFWAPGFGDNITAAPDLDGHNMKVDMANLLARLEQFYRFFYNDLGFIKPGSKADRYKMMVMLDYSLEGTAYGGDYDGEIGALWIAPNRVQDSKLNCIAHELGHSFQSQISCDGEGEAWGGHGIFEMASQWMLWRVNPDWPTDENYHLEAFKKNTNKAFLHIENIYRSPYILEYWAEKHGDRAIADLFRAGRRGEDPVETYRRLHNLSQEEFNDEMFDAVRRLVNWDLSHARENMRPYANTWNTPLSKNGKWLAPDIDAVPEDYGFNFVRLDIPAPGKTTTVRFEGLSKDKKAGWRYGLVAVDSEGKSTYSEMESDRKGHICYTHPVDKNIQHLWLVVMGAPAEHRQLPALYMLDNDTTPEPNRSWNYRFSQKM